MAELQQDLPAGWSSQVDPMTGKLYYINHYTKMTTWEDPRPRSRQFHGTNKHLTNVQCESIPLQDMKPRTSPLTVKASKVQDSSLTNITDTDEAVTAISGMFPTVSETHIRLLLKNCRYMKSIFPDVDETVILETLLNNENNIQKGSEILMNMGYTKKNTVKEAQQKMEAKKEEQKREEEEQEKRAHPTVPEIKIKTKEEKSRMKAELQEKYKDVAEHLIVIALESVNFDENRANQILQIMIQEDTEVNNKKEEEKENVVEDTMSLPSTSTSNLPVSQSRQSLKSLLKEKPEKEKEKSYSRVITGKDTIDGFPSKNLVNTSGPNPTNAMGTNEKLLLEDYIRWQGPNPNLRRGPQGLAKGPSVNFFSRRSYQPCGPNSTLRKGPKYGLATGSIFSRLKTVIVTDL